ncbi:type II toxin-antitoxin system RelE/ParE family toxin [Candidatus Woesearchaeota archaeon]|nr:type II toxin-antitoxin system RelE/ParE family toxin [Candidatus Woesearchaeota archaeon]
MYQDIYSEEIVKKLKTLKKKNHPHYDRVRRKMDDILLNPDHTYKILHNTMKGIMRVHLGHFVLVFVINHINKTISFEDYDHHDNIYE